MYLLNGGIRVDYNVENFLPDQDPVIEDYRAFTEQFPADDAFIIVAFESDSIFTPSVLGDISDITHAFEDLEGVASVSSLTNHERLRIDGDEILFERVVDPLVRDAGLLGEQRTAILDDTTATGYLISRAGDVAAFFIHMLDEDAGYDERQIVIEGARAITSEYADRYDFKYSGIPLIRNVYVDSIRDDTARYVGLATIVILLALFWAFPECQGARPAGRYRLSGRALDDRHHDVVGRIARRALVCDCRDHPCCRGGRFGTPDQPLQ